MERLDIVVTVKICQSGNWHLLQNDPRRADHKASHHVGRV